MDENAVSVSSWYAPERRATEVDIRTQRLRLSIDNEMIANTRGQDLVRTVTEQATRQIRDRLEEQLRAQLAQQETSLQRNEEPATLTTPLLFDEQTGNNNRIRGSLSEYARERLLSTARESYRPIYTINDRSIRGNRSNFIYTADREMWHSSRVFQDYDDCHEKRESELKKAIREEVKRVTKEANELQSGTHSYHLYDAIVLLSPEAYEMLVDSGEAKRGERTVNVCSPNTSVIVPGLTDLFKVIPQGDQWYKEGGH